MHIWDIHALRVLLLSSLGFIPPPGLSDLVPLSIEHSMRASDDLFRVPRHSRTTRFALPADHDANRRSSIQSWFLSNSGHLPPLPTDLSPFRFPFPPPSSRRAHGFLNDFRQLESFSASSVITVEDNGPSVSWSCPAPAIFNPWFLQLAMLPSRWSFSRIPTTTVVNFYRLSLRRIFPRSLLSRTNSFASQMFPYAYPTIKWNCFLRAADLFLWFFPMHAL